MKTKVFGVGTILILAVISLAWSTTKVNQNKVSSGPKTIMEFEENCVAEGEILDYDQEKSCCPSLSLKWNYQLTQDKQCLPIEDNLKHQRICLKCPDGICGQGENGCNCPQDCNDYRCTGEGEIPRYTGPGDDMAIQCCPGLSHRAQKEYFDPGCNSEPVGGYTGICLACGDGFCNHQYESECNCAEDCSR
ncbi:MAG: hypothetical protein ABID04_02140 [Patescibacteria group bacterium]